MTINPNAKHIHTSMFGTYHIPCEVISTEAYGDTFTIKFICPYEEIEKTETVEANRVVDYIPIKNKAKHLESGWFAEQFKSAKMSLMVHKTPIELVALGQSITLPPSKEEMEIFLVFGAIIAIGGGASLIKYKLCR